MVLNAAQADSSIRCDECPIRHRAVCAYCNHDELARLDKIKRYRTWEAGETIAWAGEKMYLTGSVVSGVATLSSTLTDGRRQMIGLLLPSDFLGRPGREHLKYDVVAATQITFCMFRKSEFDQLVLSSPNISKRLLEMTMDDLDAAREWMLLLGRKTAREKIASLFVIMARRDSALLRKSPTDDLVFPLYISRESMADYLGLTIETVSRQVSALRRDGIINLVNKRTVFVPDFDRLLEVSADEGEIRQSSG